jgi:hypothetical protein
MTQTALTEKQSLYRISGKLRKIRRQKDHQLDGHKILLAPDK